jgi:hypothetical protein
MDLDGDLAHTAGGPSAVRLGHGRRRQRLVSGKGIDGPSRVQSDALRSFEGDMGIRQHVLYGLV